ncbi:isoamylase early set domain-containing protein [Candidatus Moduliflexota bacterium]
MKKAVKNAGTARARNQKSAKARKKATPRKAGGPSKRYLKTRPACRVTFRLPAAAAPGAGEVSILGDFTGWSLSPVAMRRLKCGDFSVTIELAAGREYRYRYLLDGEQWENDWSADRYDPNEFGGEDSILIL